MKKLRTAVNAVRLRLLRAELSLAPTERQRLFVLTLVIGAVCGLAAVAFHLVITKMERALSAQTAAAPGHTWIFWVVLSPALGGLVAGLLLEYVVPGARGSGVPQVKVAYASKTGEIPLRDAIGKFILASIQIGSGASLGREGPTVQICAGIARGLGRLANVSTQSRRRLIPVGAAAGIAAAFNAPIAAVTFTIEEVVGTLDQTVLSGVIVAAALAAVIERSVLGENPVLGVAHSAYALTDARSLVLYAALGVAAAGASITFSDGLLRVRARFRKQTLIPRWGQPAVGGIVAGILAALVLGILNVGGVSGGGYDVLKEALSDHLTVKVMLALCAVKLAATVASYSSGGAGGIFAPALFIGAMLGGAFGSLDRTLFHHPDETMSAFALVGMGAVFSGTIRAPMTSILIIVEMTSGYGLILPLMIANMSAYVIARSFRPKPIYDALLEQDGIHLPAITGQRQMPEGITLGSVLEQKAVSTLSPKSSWKDMILACRAAPEQTLFPIVDGEDAFVGVVTREIILSLVEEADLEGLVTVADVMVSAVALRTTDDLRAVLPVVQAATGQSFPVVDDRNRVVAMIDEAFIAKAYLRAKPAE